MLFSEPKIPQPRIDAVQNSELESFSALQRAENSSTPARARDPRRDAEVSVLFSEPKIPQLASGFVRLTLEAEFQCSSASRKFLNRLPLCATSLPTQRFSALQRAENSSTRRRGCLASRRALFQCSSASRKFLNFSTQSEMRETSSAFQCSSASRKFLNRCHSCVGAA